MIESPVSDAALLERLRTLRLILPAMAADVASARREGSRLRRENAALLERLRCIYSAAQYFNHSPDDFASFFAGADVVTPGISEGKRWLAGVSAPLPERDVYVLCGAAVKP